MLQRHVSWVRLGVLGLASLLGEVHCGTSTPGDSSTDTPPPAGDRSGPADPAVTDSVPIGPDGVESGDTSPPEIGGQTGDDSGDIGLRCDVVTESSLALDDASALGFSANDRLAIVLGTHELPMRWLAPVYGDNGGLLDYAARGTTSLRVDVELLSHEARLLERWDSRYDMACPPRLRVDARLSVSSADGALADSVDGVAELGPGNGILNLTAELPVAALRGNYVFEPSELDGQAPSGLRISMAFTRYGQLGEVAQQYGEGERGSAIRGAQWPDWQPCQRWGWVPADYTGPRPSVSDLVDDVLRLQPVVILRPDGTRTPAQLQLEAVPSSSCHTPATDGALPSATDSLETLSVRTHLTLTSDALPGPVQLTSDLASNFAPDSEEATSYLSSELTPCGTLGYYSPQDFVTHCGDWGIDLTGVDSVFLGSESYITPAGGYSVFHISGMHAPGCTPSPQGLVCPEGASDGEHEIVELGNVRVILGTP